MSNLTLRRVPSLFDEISNFWSNDIWEDLLPVKTINRSPICYSSEDKDKYKFDFELPGVDQKNINVERNGDYLTVSVSQEQNEKTENSSSYRSFKFTKAFAIPENVKAEEIDAKLKDGIFSLILPKIKEEKKKIEAKKIEVKTN